MSEEIKRYEKMGGKTLLVFILKRCGVIFLPIILLAMVIAASFFVPIDYAGYVNLAMIIVWVVLAGTFFIILLVGWLEYLRYRISIDGESIKINRGIISEEQIGIPFRRIRQAVIERGIIDQIIGVSHLTIKVSGDEDGSNNGYQESKVVLPALYKKIAVDIQDLILEKAQVEEMNVRHGHGIIAK